MVSVIITCYQQADFIGEAIESVLKQTAADFIDKIIVINDGSTDNSTAVILKYCVRSPKIKYFYKENKGLSAARNYGIVRTSSPFIAFLDGDDLWIEDKIERQLFYINKYPDAGLFYSDYILFNGKRLPAKVNRYQYNDRNVLKKYFIHDGPILPSTVFMKKEIFSSLGMFRDLFKGTEDTDMWLRTIKNYPIQHVPFYTTLKRVHEKSISYDNESRMFFLMEYTKEIIGEYPEIKAYAQRREARLFANIGYKKLLRNDVKKARWFFKEAIKKDLLFIKSYFYFLLTFLPLARKKGAVYYLKRVVNIIRL